MSESSHPLHHPSVDVAAKPAAAPPTAAAGTPTWPNFTGTPQLVGTSASQVSVYVDPSLGAQGTQSADALLAAADGVVAKNNAIFAVTGGATNVIVWALNGPTDGTGG